MFDGAYPPGVEGWMLDYLDPAEPPTSCENCMYYEERTCGYICGLKEAEYTAKELDSMSDEEYMEKFGTNPDDYCDDHEFWED